MISDKVGQVLPGVSNKSTVWNKLTGQDIFPKIDKHTVLS